MPVFLVRGLKGVDEERGSSKASSKSFTNDLGKSGLSRQALETLSSKAFGIEFSVLVGLCFLPMPLIMIQPECNKPHQIDGVYLLNAILNSLLNQIIKHSPSILVRLEHLYRSPLLWMVHHP
jgi:hypothetical protein